MTSIKIMYRPEQYKQNEIGVKLDEMEKATTMGSTESITTEQPNIVQMSATVFSETEKFKNNINQLKTRTWDTLLSKLETIPSLVSKWLQ